MGPTPIRRSWRWPRRPAISSAEMSDNRAGLDLTRDPIVFLGRVGRSGPVAADERSLVMFVEVLDRHPRCLAVSSNLKGDPARSIGILAGRLHGEDVAVVVGQRVGAQFWTDLQREPFCPFGNSYVSVEVAAERSGIGRGR